MYKASECDVKFVMGWPREVKIKLVQFKMPYNSPTMHRESWADVELCNDRIL